MARAQNVPISCSVLREKALQIAAELGEPNFMVSNGWIQRFKVRHDLTLKTVCGEAGGVDETVLNDWRKSVLEDDILKRYKPCDVFNVDECDRQFVKKKKRKVVFIANNYTAHTNISQLASIELVFLSDQRSPTIGSRSYSKPKSEHRKLPPKDLITIDQKKEFHVTVLDAIFYVHKSWNMVSTTCIANCFRHAGLVSSLNIVDDETEEDDILLSVFIEYLKNHGHAIEGKAEYGLFDEEIATTSESTISEIFSNCGQ
ncbi:tigger transposable element-derived protein 4-like [Parasteatoda tepidariorum]|uniref:tigger transposable element-derived protein 4-like n=1 Tax=Parasteatoda tepidariorum TaxID=114398 RepID=UPI0039BD0957